MYPKSIIEQVVKSQRERLKKTARGMLRQISGFEKLTTHAFVVSGVRRCGKSTVLQQIDAASNEPSIYLNFEDPRLAGFDLSDFNRLHEIAEEAGINRYFFDEIQLIKGWESFIRFRLDENYRIFISGSNEKILSKELGSKLTGRHITRELFPFSYQEYLEFTGKSRNEESSAQYLHDGGFPEYLKTELDDVLMQVFNDIISRDIILRYRIKNSELIRQLAVWLISHLGKPFTGNRLKKMWQIGSSASIMEYLSYFEDTYLFFFIPKFSYSRKVQLVNPRKIYCIDNGLARVNSVSFTEDRDRFLENMVFLYLRRQTKEIFYFQDDHECDFVVFKQQKLIGLYQVSWKLDQDNMERETSGLLEAMKFFNVDRGSIITMNQSDKFDIDEKVIDVVPFSGWKG